MATDLREKTATLRRLLAEAERLSAGGAPGGGPGIAEIRARDRARKRVTLLEAKALWIPKPADIARREDLESDVFRWLPWYLPDVFVDPFQEHHSEMVRGILAAIVHGGDQAFAAPRGEGKTTLTEGVAIYCILRGLIQFVVIFATRGLDAAVRGLNRILRAELPKRVELTPAERAKLVKLGRKVGPSLKELITIVCYRTFARWLRGESSKRKPAKAGGPRRPEEIRASVIQMAKDMCGSVRRALVVRDTINSAVADDARFSTIGPPRAHTSASPRSLDRRFRRQWGYRRAGQNPVDQRTDRRSICRNYPSRGNCGLTTRWLGCILLMGTVKVLLILG